MPKEYGDLGLIVPEVGDYADSQADVPRAFREYTDSLGERLSAPEGQILIAQDTGAAAFKAMKGDATIDEEGNLQLGEEVVDTVQMADGAATTEKVADAAVTAVKLGAGAVEAAKIKNGAVTREKLSSFIQTARTAELNVPNGAFVEFDLVWPTPFADAEYSVSHMIQRVSGGTTGLDLVILGRFADKVQGKLTNGSGVTTKMILHLTAVHD